MIDYKKITDIENKIRAIDNMALIRYTFEALQIKEDNIL